MSIWVRLIGGPCNGQVQKIDDNQNSIIMPERQPAPGASSHRHFGLSRRHFGLSPATVEVKSTIYTRRAVYSAGGKITFFAPEGVTDFEALQSVLGP